MRNSSTWIRFVALAALLPLGACSPAEEGTEMEGTDPMEEEAPAAEAPMDPMMEPMTMMLEPRNESGVTGEVTARHHADSVTLDASIDGAAQEGDYPAHIHAGDCTAPGEVLAPLNSLATSGGTGSSTTTLAASQVPEGQPAVVQVHDPSGQPVACADLRGHGDMGGMDEG